MNKYPIFFLLPHFSLLPVLLIDQTQLESRGLESSGDAVHMGLTPGTQTRMENCGE